MSLVTLEYAGVVDFDDLFPAGDPPKRHGNRGIPSAQCSCGLFAKFLRTEYGYNGSHSTETMHVDCTRCGTTAVRLV